MALEKESIKPQPVDGSNIPTSQTCEEVNKANRYDASEMVLNQHHTFNVSKKSWKDIILHSLKGGLRGFLLAYSIRCGVALFLKLFLGLRQRQKINLSMTFYRVFSNSSAIRSGKFIGVYTAIWKLVHNGLLKVRPKSDKLNGFISGSIAGLSLLLESKANRVYFSQQLFVRAMQCCYNGLKMRGLFSFHNGDALLFILGSAHVMYAYALHPKTIPPEYYRFMLKTAVIPHHVLELNRKIVRGQFVDPEMISESLKKLKAGPQLIQKVANMGPLNAILPCSVLHPGHSSCACYGTWLWKHVFTSIFPVYLSLNFVPMLVLRLKKFLFSPIEGTLWSIANSLRSSVFLSFFVTIFQGLICVQRKSIFPGSYFTRDNKFFYYLVGLLCSTSIFIEHKSRRSELALYVLPRAMSSFYSVLYQRSWMFKLPHFETALFSMTMGIIMAFYQTEHSAMSSWLYRIMYHFLHKN